MPSPPFHHPDRLLAAIALLPISGRPLPPPPTAPDPIPAALAPAASALHLAAPGRRIWQPAAPHLAAAATILPSHPATVVIQHTTACVVCKSLT
jgi:hypothetical protein